ncbi:hypothetical protein BDF20DRAFT_664632 [Mycotypha africana]|uniref:uncharacterized protein n=1 Tax=Mycotypha africana TaxID=64632 RepID=UPI0022FFC9DF|nr:uncharacterized protein BDF20DRAFT_664632 [Mycotypha africana]KAI8973657.1 hypothetical protein BDF20DRAFT_664632 [Mycotypha africana]
MVNGASPENRQQVLIEALVGPSVRSSHAEPLNASSILPPNHFQPPPFMPSHLDVLQGSTSPSILSNSTPSTINDNSPMISLFNNNRVSTPLEPENATTTRRSITSIAPIGQPLTGRRISAAHLSNNHNADALSSSALHFEPAMTTDPLIAASHAIKRPSVASPFDTTGQEPRSFFSSFLFGDARSSQHSVPPAASVASNFVPLKDYDRPFSSTATNTNQPPVSAIGFSNRRISNDMVGPSTQRKWTNGWTASNLLSEDVHGKLFGDALVE